MSSKFTGEDGVTFHVQAGASVGMGHLIRSDKLMAELRSQGFITTMNMDTDEIGLNEAGIRGHHVSQSNILRRGPLVIDAVHISSIIASQAMSCFPRIIISPTCDRFDLATHVLVRDAPENILDQISSGVKLHVNSDFAFATAQGLSLFDLKYDSIKVGVCLSGGNDSLDLESVLLAVLSTDNVSEIRVIDRRSPVISIYKDIEVLHISHCNQPWDFFRGINVFVGGDGVMLSEAIAQGIPSISLTTNDRIQKNRSLVEAGVLRPILRKPFNGKALTCLLSNYFMLSEMHVAAKHMNGSLRAQALSSQIIEILRGKSL